MRRTNFLLLFFAVVLLSACSGYFNREDELIVVKNILVGDNKDIIVSYNNDTLTGNFKTRVRKNDLIATAGKNVTRVIAHDFTGEERTGVITSIYTAPDGIKFYKMLHFPPMELKNGLSFNEGDYVQLSDNGSLQIIEKAPGAFLHFIYVASLIIAIICFIISFARWNGAYFLLGVIMFLIRLYLCFYVHY